MTEGKMIRNRQMNMLIMIAIIVGICIPLFFTAVQIGVFAERASRRSQAGSDR